MLRRTSLLWRSSCGQSEDEKDDDQDQDHHVVSVYQDDDDQYVRVDDPHLDCLHLQGWTSWSRTHFSLRHHLWSFKVREAVKKTNRWDKWPKCGWVECGGPNLL